MSRIALAVAIAVCAGSTAHADDASGWLRVDTDAADTQFWLGATHDLGPISIASDIYVVGSFAELDVGPTFSVGPVSITPMVGVGFDFSETNLASLIAPQLFTIYDQQYVYAESWIQVFYNSVFDDMAEDVFYTRNFVLAKLGDVAAVGPQVEVSAPLDGGGVASVPAGGRVNLGYGKNNTLGLFLGYDAKAPGSSDKLAGRFTFIRTW